MAKSTNTRITFDHSKGPESNDTLHAIISKDGSVGVCGTMGFLTSFLEAGERIVPVMSLTLKGRPLKKKKGARRG